MAGATRAQLGVGPRERATVPARRYAHCVRVARLAERLAVRHGEPPAAARAAGLLHDIARLIDPATLLTACRARGVDVDRFAAANPIVLHAPLGAALARERLGIGDERILRAIARHTVAAAEMSRLEQIVFLADGLEPGRRFAERESLLALAFEDLDTAMARLLESTMRYLNGSGLEIAPTMVAALAALQPHERTSLSA